jgi:hypothetical protein
LIVVGFGGEIRSGKWNNQKEEPMANENDGGLTSTTGPSFQSAELETRWRTIAMRRLQEHERGETKDIPADQVYERIRTRIREKQSTKSQ